MGTRMMTIFHCRLPLKIIRSSGLTWPSEELYRDAASEERLFKAAMKTYEDTTKNSKYQTHITSDKIHTWEEVLIEVNAASERYNEVSGFWGKIRKGLRKFGDNNRVFDAWVGLLPSQSQYLSILCGGLKLIFSVRATVVLCLNIY